MVEMVEILDGRLGKRLVEQFITLSHCEIWNHFARTLYFHSPWARDNTVVTREIYRHISRLIHLLP